MQYFSFYMVILITGLFVSGCDQEPQNPKKRHSRPHTVSTELIQSASSTIERRFNALLVAPNTININTQITGIINTIPFRVGAIVNKGDILVTLDSSLAQAEYQKALANLEKANQDLQRIKKLIPQQLASTEQLSAAITEKKLAEAEQTLKRIQLNHCTIKAPFSGVISKRLFEPGDTSTLNAHVLTLIDNTNLIIKSAIPESLISHIALNKEALINIPALSKAIKGSISSIYPTVDNTTQQISIEVSINTNNIKLFPGQFAELILQFQSEDVIQVPVNSIQYDTKGTWIYTVDEKQMSQQTRITTGKNINNKIEVLHGLKKGDIIITRGFTGLRPGKKVNSNIKNNNAN